MSDLVALRLLLKAVNPLLRSTSSVVDRVLWPQSDHRACSPDFQGGYRAALEELRRSEDFQKLTQLVPRVRELLVAMPRELVLTEEQL